MRYDSEIKARVPSPWLEALAAEAQTEGLKVSDILRRAVRRHLGRRAVVPRLRESTAHAQAAPAVTHAHGLSRTYTD